MSLSAKLKAQKQRVVLPLGGVRRELFSVEERSSGDLGLYLKYGREFDLAEEDNHDAILEHRFSVHVSPKSPGHTIKQTLRSERGARTTSALILPRRGARARPSGIIIPPSDIFCWPLFAMRTSDLSAPRYESHPKLQDRLVELPSYDPSRLSLIYMLVATSKDVDVLATTRGRFDQKLMEFKRFNIHVLFGFSLVPSLTNSDMLTFATSEEQLGPTTAAPQSGARRSLDELKVEGAFFYALRRFTDLYAQRARRAMEAASDPEAEPISVFLATRANTCVATPPVDLQERRSVYAAYLDEIRASSVQRSLDKSAAVQRVFKALDEGNGLAAVL